MPPDALTVLARARNSSSEGTWNAANGLPVQLHMNPTLIGVPVAGAIDDAVVDEDSRG
jgi:hypothetical protein